MSFPLWISYFSQGVDTTDTRQVSTKVPLAQVPYIMRALGFYPTEQEVCYHNLVIAHLSKSQDQIYNFSGMRLSRCPENLRTISIKFVLEL